MQAVKTESLYCFGDGEVGGATVGVAAGESARGVEGEVVIEGLMDCNFAASAASRFWTIKEMRRLEGSLGASGFRSI